LQPIFYPPQANDQANPNNHGDVKELQFCVCTGEKLLHLSFEQTENIEMKKEIDDKLSSRNIKPTAMRQLVLNILEGQKTAISLHELENKFDRAEKSTLYRTLKTFEENKLIHSIDDGSGSIKYAICKDTCQCNPSDLHVHFLCSSCKQTYCLNEIPVPIINLPENYSFKRVNMVVEGICSNCKK